MISVIRQVLSGQTDFIYLIISLGAMAFVVFCTLPLHEFAHAFIAVKLGDDTPRLSGRLTINPMAHISPMGALMIFLFGFGYAKPVPVRMRHFKNPKRDMAIVALAGPLCNILQAFVYMILFCAITNINTTNMGIVYIAFFFYYAAQVNVSLGVFNLLPIPPLDGSRLATALLPAKYYFKIMQYERYIMIGLFVLLFTGILSTPLSYLSGLLFNLIYKIASLPF
ncbi:MAG: site-2 protease family protein [Clostridia bacterium]|jgi:Zn-dependent protease|nr:site-2 protease family protein [Clostridia bacterium]